MQNSTRKATLLSGTAFIRPTAAERLTGRLMRAPDGHDGTPAPSPAPAPAPAPSPTPSPTPAPSPTEGAAEGGDDAEGFDPERSALGGGTDDEGDGDGAAAGEAEKTPEEIAAEEAAAKAAEVPETYELAAPEGMTLDADAVAEATPVFKELGLSNDQANKLMPVAAAFAKRIQDQHNSAILAQITADRKAWLDQARADPEIGGPKWKESLSTGAKALDLLGFTKGTPFRVLLDESGLGNHPEMIRAWAKIGGAIGDDPEFVRSSGAHQPKRDRAETLYPEDKPKGG